VATQSLLFVTLPNGIAAGGQLRVSVYLSPRLGGAPLLADFPDLLDWPDLLQRHGLRFEFACGGATTTVAAPRAQLRPDIWREVFKPRSRVDAYPKPDFSQRLIVSYPVRRAHAFLQWAYQFAGTQLGGREEERLFDVLLPDLMFRQGKRSTLDRTLQELRVRMWREQHPAPGPQAQPAPQAAAALTKPAGVRDMAERFSLYHRLPPAPHRPDLPHTPAEFEKTLDVHKALAAITSYPALMRSFGLVFDLELPVNFCPDSPAPDYRTLSVSKVTPGWAWHVAPEFTLPETSYVRGTGEFSAAPATAPAGVRGGNYLPSDVVNGYLALAPGLFQLIGVDVDGAMLQAMALADNFANIEDKSAIEEVLPALRSGGITLIANERAQELLRAIVDNAALQDAEAAHGPLPRPLNARDLTRGWRLDIWSSLTGRWHSLHRRNGVYRFGPDGGVVLSSSDEEGFTQLAVTQPAEDPTRKTDEIAAANGVPQPGTDLYVHERVARWNGWSLSAPRPGRPINRSPDPAHATDPDPTTDEPITPFKMQSSFTARPRSLPRLRFGARYRLRARAVDLAGNSPTLGHPVPARLAAPRGAPLPYFRFEPVPHPVVLLRTEPGRGGSLLQMVIRSFNAAPDLDTVPTAESDERHIAPPKAPVLMAEHHGMFDDPHGRVRGDQATWDMIVARDKGAFPTLGTTPIEPGPTAIVPYFPDPIARGAVFVDLPNAPDNTTGEVQAGGLRYTTLPDVESRPGSVTRIGFGAGWPDRQSFRIALVEGHAEPSWSGAARQLVVSLPKSVTIQVPLSCTLDPTDLELMGIWDWLRAWFDAVETAAMQQTEAGEGVVFEADSRALLTRLVLDGDHPMITPAITLTLTHAVQQPIGFPTWSLLPVTHNPPVDAARLGNNFAPVTAWRSHGSHHAVLLGGLEVHGQSSVRFDIEARWTEVTDDPAQPAPQRTLAGGHVDTIELRTLDPGPVAADGAATRYVAVYIPGVDALWFAAPFDTLPGVPTPLQVAAPVHQLGDTKHRRVRYRAIAASRYQEYFDAGLGFTRASTFVLVDVPSSARPMAPDVLYVVPIFGWERQESTNVKTEIRRGNGLRVYLDRPWYSSGDSELLGVVLWAQAQTAPNDDAREAAKPYITQWGLDPLWSTSPLPPIPATFDFPLATVSATNLTLEENPIIVDVAGHAVGFDAERRLWYCDITLAVGATYMPFVRLALARFQPHSIAGTELSRVVLADFAQLTPDRSAALTMDPADPQTARLFVGGIAPEGPTRSFITVTIEQRRAGVGGDLGWEPAPMSVARVTEDMPAPSDPDSVLWRGTIRLTKAAAAGHLRVVVREFELLLADPLAGAVSDTPNYAERLVYASIIPWNFPAP
jgi:hypothetical protein